MAPYYIFLAILKGIKGNAKKKKKKKQKIIGGIFSLPVQLKLSSRGWGIQMTQLLLLFERWTIEQRDETQAKTFLAVTNRQPIKGFNSAKHFTESASRKSRIYCCRRVAWESGSDIRCKNMVIVTVLGAVIWNWSHCLENFHYFLQIKLRVISINF